MIVADVTRVRAPWRGVLVGLAAAIKLTPLVFLFYFAAARDWRSLARGVGTVVVVTAPQLAGAALRLRPLLVPRGRPTPAAPVPLGVVSNQGWNGLVHRSPFDGGHFGRWSGWSCPWPPWPAGWS